MMTLVVFLGSSDNICSNTSSNTIYITIDDNYYTCDSTYLLTTTTSTTTATNG